MKTIISLKVPAEPKADFVSHGNFDAELVPGETIETDDERIARWLVSDYDLEETGRREVETKKDEPETADNADTPTVDAEDYPDGFPGRDALVDANVPFATAKALTAEQLVEYKGIGAKTADAIVEFFAAGGTE